MRSKETGRLETFSDGVFAIAITLLILEIKTPAFSSVTSRGDLWHRIGELWPSYFAFVLTFGFITIAWLCHHALFNLLDSISSQLIYANAFLLLNIVFLPFPTALLAEFFMSKYDQPAVVFYCLCNLFTGISWNLLYYFTLKPKPLIKEKAFSNSIRTMQKNARYGLLINLFIAILAWWLPLVSLIINTCLWFFWFRQGVTMLRQEKAI